MRRIITNTKPMDFIAGVLSIDNEFQRFLDLRRAAAPPRLRQSVIDAERERRNG